MYYLFIIGKFLALIFPRAVCYFVAKILAHLHFYLSTTDRESVYYNFSVFVSDKKKLKKYAKEVFVNFSYYLVDFFRYQKLNSEFISKYVHINGWENLEEAIFRKKGIILLSPHFGNYELGAAIFSMLGYSFYSIVLPHKDRRIDDFFNKQRSMVGLKVFLLGYNPKKYLKLLKEGKILALLADRDFSNSSIKVKIFSRYALVPRGPAFFALKTGATIIPSFLIREKKFFYNLIFEKPIFCDNNRYKKEEEIVSAYITVLERYLKRYPQQWYLFEKYWLKS
ncbi:MAG: lysophospholipid acyltransferase family protein [Candidatus Omnitrophica bacterium]|nr:lysophospholipid acyltransferase family protein [Candidatus Omnitrophota bacterium]